MPCRGRYKPIRGYGIIGDTRTAALIGFDGSIDWCCLPRFDSPSIFASILDFQRGGKWSIRPISKSTSSQYYHDNTNVLVTEFRSNHSLASIIDFMPCTSTSDFTSYPSEIHRIVECRKGHLEFQLDFQPRPDYARDHVEFYPVQHGVSVKSERHQLVLASSLKFRSSNRTGVSRSFELCRHEKQVFVLRHNESQPKPIQEYGTESKLGETIEYWSDWSSKLKCGPRWKEMIHRSALTLKLLSYSPTGAIVAAPTTSLPEAIGAGRNWDYRFSWIRDTALSLWAFHLLGDGTPAERYHQWLIENNLGISSKLRLMHQVDGRTITSEEILSHFEGYMGSKPVRIGNAASRQFQIDAYGYMLDGLYYSSKHGSNMSENVYQRCVKRLANYICENWKKPGHGIWEVRDRTEQYVYTKAWCIAGLQRAIKIARSMEHFEDVEAWRNVTKQIRKEMLGKGWSPVKKAFRRTYESEDLDAASLMIPLMGVLPAKDHRIVRTVDAITDELSHGPLLYRYKTRDGLYGDEGAFLLCSFWLVACLAKMGRVQKAKNIFEQLLTYSNHLGLYSEEIDPDTGNFLGNFPQAFSHMGLIMAAHELNKVL